MSPTSPLPEPEPTRPQDDGRAPAAPAHGGGPGRFPRLMGRPSWTHWTTALRGPVAVRPRRYAGCAGSGRQPGGDWRAHRT
jgi:hypothetical protein